MDTALFKNSPSGKLIRATGRDWAFVPNPLPPSFDVLVGLPLAFLKMLLIIFFVHRILRRCLTSAFYNARIPALWFFLSDAK